MLLSISFEVHPTALESCSTAPEISPDLSFSCIKQISLIQTP